MAPCLVEYRGASVSGSKEASSQHTQHSITLCHTPAQMICMSGAVIASRSQQLMPWLIKQDCSATCEKLFYWYSLMPPYNSTSAALFKGHSYGDGRSHEDLHVHS